VDQRHNRRFEDQQIAWMEAWEQPKFCLEKNEKSSTAAQT
jgi:hypothetical protein